MMLSILPLGWGDVSEEEDDGGPNFHKTRVRVQTDVLL